MCPKEKEGGLLGVVKTLNGPGQKVTRRVLGGGGKPLITVATTLRRRYFTKREGVSLKAATGQRCKSLDEKVGPRNGGMLESKSLDMTTINKHRWGGLAVSYR